MSTYALGTVAVATVRGVPNVRVMAGEGTAEPKLRWVTTDNRVYAAGDPEDDMWFFDFQVTDVRPLVVLDLGSRDQRYTVADLRDAHKRTHNANLADIAAQIEAQTRPPKPPEPTGLGAVVEDAEGEKWVRTHTELDAHWRSGDFQGRYAEWRHVDAVRVLSEGWSE